MKHRPTQIEIAKLAGVSQRVVASVVGRVGSGGPRVSEATRERILAIAQELGYRPQRQAQLLRGVKSGLIGVVNNVTLHQVNVEKAYHASLAIHRAGYGLLAQEVVWHNEKDTAQSVEMLLDARVEGVLLTIDAGGHYCESLQKAGIPVVSLGSPQGNDVPFVAPDHRQGMRDLAKHLFSLGHRRLVMETTMNTDSGRNWGMSERLAGFLEACEQAGLEQGDRRVIRQPFREASFDYPEMGRQVARMMLDAEEGLPDVLLCQNDLHAAGALKYFSENGIDVPGRLALTGFDNTAIGRHLAVPLTTVEQPAIEMANCAVELLVGLIRGEKSPASIPQATFLPCELVVRESCGAAGHLKTPFFKPPTQQPTR